MTEEVLDDVALCARIAGGAKPEARDALGELYGRHAQAVLAIVRRTGPGSALPCGLPAARLLRRHLLSRPSTEPPISRPRLLTRLLASLLLVLSAQRLAPGLAFSLAPAPATLVLVLPWLPSLAAFELRVVLGALRDGFDERPMELPPERRVRSRRSLRGLAGLSIATGVLATLAATAGFLQELALAPQPAGPERRALGALGSMPLAPAYGVALAYFFYAPLAGADEEREGLEEVG